MPYLGGHGNSSGNGIAVDSSGNTYVTGTTFNSNPPPGSFGGVSFDAFVVKLSSVGSLSYSNFLGGSQNDSGDDIAVDSDGNVYVTGFTQSTNFPIFNPIQTCGGNGDAFVSKLNPSGGILLYSTCLGGSLYDFPKSIDIDSSRNAYITGATFSSDFPLLNPIQQAFGGEIDGFVSKLNSVGNGLVYSTYLGGSGEDQSYGIAVSGAEEVYVTGWTSSTNFPLQVPIQKALIRGAYDAFVARINTFGNGLIYSTYLGGNGDDRANSIALDSVGNAYLTGVTSSSNFHLVIPFQPTYIPDQLGIDAFVSKISPTGSSDPADFNADAQSDLLWRNTNGTLVVWTMNGVTSTGGGYIGSTTTDWKVVGTGDFNKDGQADIFWRNDNGSLYVWYMNGLNYLSGSYVGSVTTDWKIASLADFNSDGNIDILWRNDNGTLAVWYMNGINFVNVVYIGSTTIDWKVAGTGDFNNDRKPDLLWRNDNGSLAVWYLNGINYLGFDSIGQTSTDWKVVAVSDFNSDGKNDLIFENDNGTLGAWYLNGTTYLGFTYLNPNQVDPSWRIVAPH